MYILMYRCPDVHPKVIHQHGGVIHLKVPRIRLNLGWPFPGTLKSANATARGSRQERLIVASPSRVLEISAACIVNLERHRSEAHYWTWGSSGDRIGPLLSTPAKVVCMEQHIRILSLFTNKHEPCLLPSTHNDCYHYIL
jgi:hypothetical protein